MASFAAQLKDKFLGLVYRVTGWGGCSTGTGAGAGRDKDVPEATKLPNVQQPVETRSRDPVVGPGSVAGNN